VVPGTCSTARVGVYGVAVDQPQGLQWLRQGCDGKAGNACFELGFAHSTGNGVDQDSQRAASLYARSCSLGTVNGCSSLGVLYMDGLYISASSFTPISGQVTVEPSRPSLHRPSLPRYQSDPMGRAYGSLGTQRTWTSIEPQQLWQDAVLPGVEHSICLWSSFGLLFWDS
jgi:TPR repeat protein